MKWNNIGLSARITLGAMALLLVGSLLWINNENQRLHNVYVQERAANLEAVSHVEKARLIEALGTLRQDVLFLADMPPVQGMVRATTNHGFDARDKNSLAEWEKRLQEIFAAFLRAHPDYSHARFIGLADAGRELVRVNVSGRRALIVPHSELQAKGDREFFKAGLKLRRGQVYLSEFNLEQDWGRITQPRQPTLRAVTPVFDAQGKRFGMVVLNMSAAPLFSAAAAALPQGVQAYVADAQGHYLSHPDAERAFMFELGSKERITDDFPSLNVFSAALTQSYLPLQLDPLLGGYMAAERVYFDPENPARFLLLVYHIPAQVVSAQAYGITGASIAEAAIVTILSALLFLLVLRRLFFPLRYLTSAAEKIAAGKHPPHLRKIGGGELGKLTDALNAMLLKLSKQDALEQENNFRKELVESLPGVFYMIDAAGQFVMWNRNLERVLGMDAGELSGLPALAVFEGEDRQVIERKIGEVFSKGEATVEAEIVAKDGSRTPFYFTGRRVLQNGQPLLIGMGLDITEQRASQRIVFDTLQRNQILMQNSMEGVHVMDIEGQLLDANDSFCRMLGYTREEVLRLNVSDWDNKFSPQELRENFKALIGQHRIFETRHKRKDGSVLDVEICANGVEIEGKQYLFASGRDITQRKKSESLLLRHKQVIDTTHDGYWLTDMQGVILEANAAYAAMSGYSVHELQGMHISQLDAQEQTSEVVMAHIGKVIEAGYAVFETRHRHKDGHEMAIEISTTFMPEAQQLVVFSRDISARKRSDEELRVAAATFETHDAILITDAQANIVRVNHAFTDITGYRADEVLGKNPRIMSSGRHGADFYSAIWQQIADTGAWAGEIWDKRKNGEVYPKWLTISVVKNEQGIATQYVGIFSDITERKLAEDEIHNLAFYDALTLLPNRRLFQDRLQAALLASVRHDDHGALLFIDLDRFKLLNDTLGHAFGDMLLIEVAKRIKSCVREIDTVARLGGDEFVVLLESISDDRDDASRKAGLVAEKIRDTLAHPYLLKEHEHYSSPSIGIALFHDGEEAMEDLIKHADAAMYQAKNAGRNTVCFYDASMQKDMEVRATLDNELRRAIENKELQLYYQIQVDNTRRAVGAEALLRWLHPQRGMVPPSEFIPVAEDSSLILEIGDWVLDTACAQLARWEQDARMRQLTLAVNISANQFRMDEFVAHISAALHRHGVVPSRLKLELTESVLLSDMNGVVVKMAALRALGVKLSLDDFGTGYSSLSYLKRLPLDQLKIDQSFIRDITVDSSDAGMVQTIIDMAKNFKHDVIAEGVETEAQLVFLKHNDCMSYQGFFFGKAVPVDELEVLVRELS